MVSVRSIDQSRKLKEVNNLTCAKPSNSVHNNIADQCVELTTLSLAYFTSG